MAFSTSRDNARLRHGLFAAIAVASLMSVGGCAINTLRTGDAGVVSQASNDAGAGATAFLQIVDTEREQTNVELAAADPACATLQPQLRSKPDITSNAPATGFLCIANPVSGGDGSLTLVPISHQIEPTIKLIRAMASYGDGLAEIVNNKNPQLASADLISALDLAHAAQAAVTEIVGATDGPIPAASDGRVVAAAGLIDLLGEITAQADQARGLRKYVAANPDGIAPIIAILKRQVGGWETSRRGDDAIRGTVIGVLTARTLGANPPKSPGERRAALSLFYSEQHSVQTERLLAPAVLHALDAVASADADLRRVLIPGAKLTAAERHRVAEINRSRIVAALNGIASLAKSIGGAA